MNPITQAPCFTPGKSRQPGIHHSEEDLQRYIALLTHAAPCHDWQMLTAKGVCHHTQHCGEDLQGHSPPSMPPCDDVIIRSTAAGGSEPARRLTPGGSWQSGWGCPGPAQSAVRPGGCGELHSLPGHTLALRVEQDAHGIHIILQQLHILQREPPAWQHLWSATAGVPSGSDQDRPHHPPAPPHPAS